MSNVPLLMEAGELSNEVLDINRRFFVGEKGPRLLFDGTLVSMKSA